MCKKYSILALVLALILSVMLLVGCAAEKNTPSDSSDDTQQNVEESSTEPEVNGKAEVAEDFAVAALSCDKESIAACVYADMQEAFVKAYGENEFVFSNVKAEAIDEIVLFQEGIESYISMLSREFDIKVNIETLSSFTVDFTAEYNGKEYSGAMSVMVGEFAGGVYVISAELDGMEDAFYEDNCPNGEFYFDMHGEE